MIRQETRIPAGYQQKPTQLKSHTRPPRRLPDGSGALASRWLAEADTQPGNHSGRAFEMTQKEYDGTADVDSWRLPQD